MAGHHIVKPVTHEIGRLRQRISSLEKQVEHDAAVKSAQADRIAELEAELDDAARLGTQYATVGRAFSSADGVVTVRERGG